MSNAMITLSKPSKLPCPGFSLPAAACKTGSKLAKVEGSICNKCYACKGNYTFPNVQKVLESRLQSIQGDGWVNDMVNLIRKNNKNNYFRWHDSGDIQSTGHLEKIVTIALALPNIKFWLPTREVNFVREYLSQGKVLPPNLIVRISAMMVDKPPVNVDGMLTSTVHKNGEGYGYICPAPKQEGKCNDCRACWDKKVSNVSYKSH